MDPESRPVTARRAAPIAASVCLASFVCFWLAQRAAHVSTIDLLVYRAEGWTVRTGGDLYAMRATHAHLPTTYPPFAALLFTPLTLLATAPLRALATAANLALLLALTHLSLRLTGRPPRAAVTLVAAALCVWCEPVWTTLRYGQVNLLLAVLVLWDLTRAAGRGGRWAGVGIGLAAGIKLTPALFAVFLAATGFTRRPGEASGGELRQAALACAAFTGTAAVGALALPYDSWRYWTAMLFAADRVGHAEDAADQSLRGVLARLLHTGDPGPWWAATAAVVAALGLAVAVRARLYGPEPTAHAWGVLCCAATALLVSPVSWSHHWVWCVPMVLLLVSEAATATGRRRAAWWAAAAAAGALFCSYALWRVPHTSAARLELHQSGGQMLLSAGYPAAGAAFLLLAAVRTPRPGPDELSDHRADRSRPRGGTPLPRPASPRRGASSPCPRAPAGGSGT
ncbi:glycosyltransferase 87 family protein [Streptomyces sp. NPDC020379]|uniref:glycosyltransferase 87 family protein n=1 Tax=Streptomyces sp. NPDC020379 TaxID=3365071 RepID=UPI0037AD018B